MRTQRRIWFALMLGLLSPAWGSPLTSGADFLLMPVGARPDGMGQAYSAVGDDLYTLSFNPAGLAGIRQLQLGYGREEFVAGIHYDFLGVGAPVADLGVLSLGYIGLGIDPFESTGAPAASLVSVSDMAFLAAWGKSFSLFEDAASLQTGFAVKYINRQLAGTQGTGFAFDAGLRVLPTRGLVLSASALNMGPGIQFSNTEPLPTLLDLGAAYKILAQGPHSLTIAGDYSMRLFSQTQQYNLGLEYWFLGQFAVRTGYVFNSQVEGPSVGAGIKLDFIELDYAFQPDNNLGSIHRLSGLLRLDGASNGPAALAPPGKLEVQPTAAGFKASWSDSDSMDQSYEVLIRPLTGGPLIVPKAVRGSSYSYNDNGSHELFSVQVRALGQNGKKSEPSQAALVFSAGEKESEFSPEGIKAQTNKIGLYLSWAAPTGASGYNLYYLSPTGKVVRLNLAPKKNNKLLLSNELSWKNTRIIVTALGPDGISEKMVGSYVWNPGGRAPLALSQAPVIKLQANLTHDQQIFLAWDSYPDVKGYSLFYSSQPDGVYEFYGDLTDPKPTALLQMVTKEKELHFLLAALSQEGKWVARSNDSKVSMGVEP